jgi:hypothetical protein
MSLTTRLKKLEDSAGKGKWCAYCRLTLSSSPPVAETYARTREVPTQHRRTCRFCGNRYNVGSPEGDEPRDRALRLLNTFDDEDFYRDERAAAVQAWVRYSRNRSLVESERKRERLAARHSARRAEKPTPEQKLRGRLTEEMVEQYRGWHREMIAKHGEPFAHIEELEKKIASDFYNWRSAADELERWRAWAEIEVMVFGEPLSETTERVIEYEAKAAAEEEEKRRKEAERVAREEAARQPPASPPDSYKWRERF